jgi:hypothetical protein
MAEVDLEELYDSILDGNQSAIKKTVKALLELWLDEDFDSVEIFAEETLTAEAPKKFLSEILLYSEKHPDFVKDFVASIDDKTIVHEADFARLKEMKQSSRDQDSDEFNASRSGRASIALNPECPPKILLELAGDERWEIRYRVALNPSSTSEILEVLLDGRYPEYLEDLADFIEATVALHKNSSGALLGKLAASENPIVRTAVACNPNTPSAALEQAKLLGVDSDLLNYPKSRQKIPTFRETRLCWWFWESDWTVADLENLQIPGVEHSALRKFFKAIQP